MPRTHHMVAAERSRILDPLLLRVPDGHVVERVRVEVRASSAEDGQQRSCLDRAVTPEPSS